MLKQGGLLCLAADQDAGRHGVPVRFLGRWASAATGPFELALRTGAPVVWGLIHREGPTRHRVRIDAPEVLTAHGDHGETLRYHAQAYADRLAAGVRSQPDQWFWLHRRWKTTVTAPPDTASTPH